MHLIVGLGNPGGKYALTRHNIGFMAVDAVARAYSLDSPKIEHKAEVYKWRLSSSQVLLAKPTTFMNLSGESVQPLAQYYDIPTENILVIQDDVDLPFATVRYQTARGHGGHNGVRDIHKHLGTNEYDRLKLGVGRPSNDKQSVADYALANFSKEQQTELGFLLNDVVNSLECYIQDGYQKAATQYNKNPS